MRVPVLLLVSVLGFASVSRADDDLRARAEQLLPMRHTDEEGREHARVRVIDVCVPEHERLFPGLRLFNAVYEYQVPTPPGGNVFGTFVHHKILVFERDAEPRVLTGSLFELLRDALLAAAPVAADEAARRDLVTSWMWLLQLGEAERGTWWGAGREKHSARPDGGLSLRVFWQHGKSFSTTDVYAFEWDAEGRLVAIGHEELQH
jgi:hypothetical protein